MKIAYHSLGSVDTGYGEDRGVGYPEALRGHLDAVSRSSTEVDLRGTTKGGLADSYRFFAGLDTADILENVLRMRNEDVDALAIGNIFDPGLREARELLVFPVTGQLETSILAGSFLADRVGLVSINDNQAAQSRDALRTYRLTNQVAAIEGIDADISAISTAFEDAEARANIVGTFEAAAADCIAEGAEFLVPGGGILSMLLAEFGVDAVDGVPVMDQVAVQVKLTETLVALYEMDAVRTSPVGTYEGLDSDRLDDLQDEYGI